jgi:glycosyltransferase involved in cell wall biosynthesis
VKIATLSDASVVHTRRWVETLRARGHDVRLWSLEAGPAPLDARRLPAWPLPGFLRYPLATSALKAELRAFDPDVVDAHYVPSYGLLGALAGRRPLSVSAWGSDLLIAGPRDPFQRARARFVLRRAAAVIADSGNLAAAAIALGAPRGNVHAIPWGVDLARFAAAATRERGLVASTRMHERIYDLESVIDGLAPVMRARPGTRVVFAGDGSLRAALERRARARLPAGRFEFVGRLDPSAMASLLARAELFVSGSHSDSTSVSLLEAMASGAVPVVSDIEGNHEWVEEGDGARLFPPGDAAALGAALERALADPAWLERARARNRVVVEERGNESAAFARIEALFESLARLAGRE